MGTRELVDETLIAVELEMRKASTDYDLGEPFRAMDRLDCAKSVIDTLLIAIWNEHHVSGVRG